MFVISLNYKVPIQQVERHLEAHRAFLENYYASGHFLLSGRKVPRTGGLIVASGSDRDEIEKIIAQDPFYVHQIADYEVTEFEPTQWDARLDNLIKSKE